MKPCHITWRAVFATTLLLLTGGAVEARAGTLYAVDDDRKRLVSIDTNTLAYTDIGPLGVSFNFGELAYNPYTDTLFMIDGRANNSLYTVDRLTGAATFVGRHGVPNLFGLDYDSSNAVLYGAQFFYNGGLYTLDEQSGVSTLIGNFGPDIRIGGLAYDSTRDMLIGVLDGEGRLYCIDRSTGAATFLAEIGYTNNSGLAYDSERDLLWDIDHNGYLYSYDPNNGYARTTWLSGLDSHDGLAFVPD